MWGLLIIFTIQNVNLYLVLYLFQLHLMGCCESQPRVSNSFDPQAERTDNRHPGQPPPPDPSNNNPQLISSQIKPQQVMISAKDLAQKIMDGFDISKIMQGKLENVAYTPDQLQYIIDQIVKTILKLQQPQTPQEKNDVVKLLKEMNPKELYYHRTVKQLKSKINYEVKPETLSRIYHGIANIKKIPKVNEAKENDFGIQERMTNNYESLSEYQIDQVVFYEGVSEKILELGTKINYKFSSIQKDSDGIINLLASISSRYQKDIQDMKYDLSPQEYQKVAQISREACNHHDSGVVLLFIYFVRACRNLEKSNESVKQIEEKLENTIEWISKKYPPGEGLDSEKKHLEKGLLKLQYKDEFVHKPSKLENTHDKQAQLERIILHNASLAEKSLNDFEELIREACFKLAIQAKTGLKLNPKNPNKKAMIRIKEKMLFPKDAKRKINAKETIQETINNEDKEYREEIDQLLKEKEEVTFKISDMVRGKCVFLKVEDIIDTVKEIKKFVESDTKKRYRITQIESRFTNPQPISDVTLKIAINKEIVSELQLTIQANAAAYYFAHKVYELARTKVFSKVKISHNYYEEFSGYFKVQASKILEISKSQSLKKGLSQFNLAAFATLIVQKALPNQQHSVISEQEATIQRLLNLSQEQETKSYKDVMTKSIQEQKGKLASMVVSTGKEVQKLMVILFNKQMGSWKQELGREINLVLESGQHSPLLKATLLFNFFRSFDISKQVTPMLHFHPTYNAIAQKRGYEQYSEQFKKGKDYMEIYLQEEFAIKKPFAHTRSTARLFYKALQTQKISIQKNFSSDPCLLKVEEYIKGVVLEENSPEIVDFINQLVLSFFNVRGEEHLLVPQFDLYSNYLTSILDLEVAGCSSGLVKAQQLLEEGSFSQAKNVLGGIAMALQKKKKNEEKEQRLLFDLLQAELIANTCNFKQFKEYHSKNVVKKTEALGAELRGMAVANSEWRIYRKLWSEKEKLSKEEKDYVVNTHLHKALTESSRNEGEGWIVKGVVAKQNGHQIPPQCILENQHINYINLSPYDEINGKGQFLQHIKKSRWPRLSTFECEGKAIGDVGCRHLVRANWLNLSSLNLEWNNISNDGCRYLIQTNWPNLSSLNLRLNQIGDDGCLHLSKANWSNLSSLNLGNNNIGAEGCRHLSKANWLNLSSLCLWGPIFKREQKNQLQQLIHKMSPKVNILMW